MKESKKYKISMATFRYYMRIVYGTRNKNKQGIDPNRTYLYFQFLLDDYCYVTRTVGGVCGESGDEWFYIEAV